jgi:hypothetical protein
MTEFQSLAEAKDFPSSLCVQTSSEVHWASCTMGTGGPFPVVKSSWPLASSSAEIKNEELYLFSPLASAWHVWDSFTLLYFTLLYFNSVLAPSYGHGNEPSGSLLKAFSWIAE